MSIKRPQVDEEELASMALMTRPELNEFFVQFGLKPRRINELIDKKIIRAIVLPGGRHRFKRSEVEEFGKAFAEIWHRTPTED